MEKFKMDVVNHTLTISAKFAEMMNNPESKEYKLVTQFKADFPNLRIAKRTHRTPAKYINKQGEEYKRNQFKDLTYDRMEKFMSVLPQKEAYLTEYDKVMAFACAAKRNGYPIVRKWFVEQFPQFRKNPMFYLNNQPAVIPFAEIQKQMEADETDNVVNF